MLVTPNFDVRVHILMLYQLKRGVVLNITEPHCHVIKVMFCTVNTFFF